MEAWGAALKVFFDKHLVPTIISISVAILCIIITPVDYWILTKIGTHFYMVIVACLTFLLVKLIIVITKTVKNLINKCNDTKYYRKIKYTEFSKNIDAFWSLMDSFCPNDRKLVRDFITSKNQPIEIANGAHFSSQSLLGSQYVISTKKEIDRQERVIIDPNPDRTKIAIPVESFIGLSGVTLYKLKNDFYQIAKYSMEQHNRVSHFD